MTFRSSMVGNQAMSLNQSVWRLVEGVSDNIKISSLQSS